MKFPTLLPLIILLILTVTLITSAATSPTTADIDKIKPTLLQKPPFEYIDNLGDKHKIEPLTLELVGTKNVKTEKFRRWLQINSDLLPEYELPDPYHGLKGNLPSWIPLKWKGLILVHAIKSEFHTLVTYGEDYSDRKHLMILRNSTKEIIKAYDLSNYQYAPQNNITKDYKSESFKQTLRFAQYENDILYIENSHFLDPKHSAYENSYLTAIDSNGNILWRSKPLTANKDSFIIQGDHIICLYMDYYKDNNSFINILNKYTGEIESSIAVDDMLYYLFESEGNLIIRGETNQYTYKIVEGPLRQATYLMMCDQKGTVLARPDYVPEGWFTFKSERSITVGDHIKTGSDGQILLDNIDSLFYLEPNSEVQIKSAFQYPTGKIELLSGSMDVDTKILTPPSDFPINFEIETTEAYIKSTNSNFSIKKSSGLTTIDIIRGTVEITPKKTTEHILGSTGQSIKIDENGKTSIEKCDIKQTPIEMIINDTTMKTNGINRAIDIESPICPVIIKGSAMMPIRPVFVALGGTVEYNQAEKQLTLKHNNNTLKMSINNKILTYNDKPISGTTAPVLIDGKTMIPIRTVLELFGFKVTWIEKSNRIIIN